MADSKPKIETIEDNDDTSISPNGIVGDTSVERYAKVKEREVKMSVEERVKKLREAPSIFDAVALNLLNLPKTKAIK